MNMPQEKVHRSYSPDKNNITGIKFVFNPYFYRNQGLLNLLCLILKSTSTAFAGIL